jgi:hypothetical protein
MTDQEKIEGLWQILVMLKRELDPHPNNPTKFELPRDAWREACRRAQEIIPGR